MGSIKKTWVKMAVVLAVALAMLPLGGSIAIVGPSGASVNLNASGTSVGDGNGTVTSIGTGAGLTGGPITSSGTLSAVFSAFSDTHTHNTLNLTSDSPAQFSFATSLFREINASQVNVTTLNLLGPRVSSLDNKTLVSCKNITGSPDTDFCTDATGSASSSPGFRSVASVSLASTKTNVGLSFVDWYTVAGQGNFYKQINFSGFTQFRWIAYVDYVGGGTQRVVLVNTSNTAIFDSITFTADCPCDSGWKNIPATFGSNTYSIEPMINSTTATDDPIVYGYELWLQ